MAFCFVVGCGSDFDQKNDGIGRVCPRCHNASIVGGVKKTHLELCFIPLSFIPIHKKQIWLCPVCQWFVDADRGEPQRVGQQGFYPGGPSPGQHFSQGPGGPNAVQPGYGQGPSMQLGQPPPGGGVAGHYPGHGR